MSSQVYVTLGKITSALKALGVFKSVQKVEPKGAPDSGLTCAVFLNTITPAAAASGLSSVSGVYVFTARIYTNMLQEPSERIDEILTKVVDRVFDTLAGAFTEDDTIRNIDIFGQFGAPLQAKAGYVEVDKIMFRSVDVTIPLVVNDVWSLAP